MTSVESEMDLDSGVSDMTCLESTVSDMTESTIIDGQSVRGSMCSSDSGKASSSGGRQKLPNERLDFARRTQEWVDSSEFQVFVKTLEGKTIPIKVKKDEQVISLMRKVEESTNIPVCQQYLIGAGGKKLEENERLSKYKIGEHSTIFCQCRLVGG